MGTKQKGKKEIMYVAGCSVGCVGLLWKVGRPAEPICRQKTHLEVGGPD